MHWTTVGPKGQPDVNIVLEPPAADETYKDNVRVTFAKGALLEDPKRVFNASLKGNALRAVVIGREEKSATDGD